MELRRDPLVYFFFEIENIILSTFLTKWQASILITAITLVAPTVLGCLRNFVSSKFRIFRMFFIISYSIRKLQQFRENNRNWRLILGPWRLILGPCRLTLEPCMLTLKSLPAQPGFMEAHPRPWRFILEPWSLTLEP
jgi:hypothetical protein